MYDSTFTSPPLTLPDTRKHSRIGVASFVIGILAVLIFCVAFLVAFGYGFTMATQNPSFQVDKSSQSS